MLADVQQMLLSLPDVFNTETDPSEVFQSFNKALPLENRFPLLSMLELLVTLNLMYLGNIRSLFLVVQISAMPVQLLKIIKGKLETQLPSHLQREELKHLQIGLDHTNKYFQVIY